MDNDNYDNDLKVGVGRLISAYIKAIKKIGDLEAEIQAKDFLISELVKQIDDTLPPDNGASLGGIVE